jgi:hypothetical protein
MKLRVPFNGPMATDRGATGGKATALESRPSTPRGEASARASQNEGARSSTRPPANLGGRYLGVWGRSHLWLVSKAFYNSEPNLFDPDVRASAFGFVKVRPTEVWIVDRKFFRGGLLAASDPDDLDPRTFERIG